MGLFVLLTQGLECFKCICDEGKLAVARREFAFQCDAAFGFQNIFVFRIAFGEDNGLDGAVIVGEFDKRHLVAALGEYDADVFYHAAGHGDDAGLYLAQLAECHAALGEPLFKFVERVARDVV